MSWFRFFHDFLENPKILKVSEEHQLMLVKIWCLSSESKIKGQILLTDQEICWKLRVSADKWQSAVVELCSNGLLGCQQNGYYVPDWEYNQRHRDRLPVSEWRVLRKRVFERDGYTCQYCGLHGVELQCDHVIPISRGGSNHIENLKTACKACNKSKFNKTIQEWIGGQNEMV